MNRIFNIRENAVSWLNSLSDPHNDFQFIMTTERLDSTGWTGKDDIVKPHLLFFVETSTICGQVNGTYVELPPASMIWLTPGCRRQFRVKEGMGDCRNYRLRFNLTNSANNFKFVPSWTIKTNCLELKSYFELLKCLSWQKKPYVYIEQRAILQALFASFLSPSSPVNSAFRMFTAAEMTIIEDRINNNLTTSPSQLNLPQHFGWTEDYFSRIFRNTFKMPLRTYIKVVRLRKAAEYLLDTQLTLKEICYELGEQDLSKFCRQFKDEFKCTPTQYRKRT